MLKILKSLKKVYKKHHYLVGKCLKSYEVDRLDVVVVLDNRADNGGSSAAEQQINVRSNFNPLACWIPSSITNSSGHVSFEFKLPDSLTRYRVWAVAANNKQYGLGEMSFTVQLPVMIRPSPPRFLNYGDTAHLAVILQNQTNSSLLLHTGLKASNAKLLTSQNNQQVAGYAVQLPANKRAAVTFPLSTIQAGIARFQFLVSTVANSITSILW